MNDIRDEFLSDEDLDIRNMEEEELFEYWDLWLQQAQATNDRDKHLYSHGVFAIEPAVEEPAARVAEKRAPYE